MRFFRSLRVLVISIVGALKALLWALILLSLLIYAFACFFTDQCTEFLERQEEENLNSAYRKDLKKMFGSMARSSLTLFEAMTSGVDWANVYDVLAHTGAFSCILFLVYVSFTILAMLNVITGVFCEQARENSQKDSDNVILEHMANQDHLTSQMRRVFDSIDHESAGTVTYYEFQNAFQDVEIRNAFQIIGLEPWDAMEIFHLIDPDDSGYINIDQFIEGCFHLCGGAKTIDMAIVRAEMELMNSTIQDMDHLLKDWRHESDRSKSTRSTKRSERATSRETSIKAPETSIKGRQSRLQSHWEQVNKKRASLASVALLGMGSHVVPNTGDGRKSNVRQTSLPLHDRRSDTALKRTIETIGSQP